MVQKVGDRKTLINILKSGNYIMVDTGKHEKWSNGEQSVYVPHPKSNGFSRILAEKIVKQAGLAGNN